MTAALPAGQEQSLRALGRAMLRCAAVAAVLATVVVVVGAGLLVGPSGAVSALLGAALALLSPLITLFFLRITAPREPRVVMVASFNSSLVKALLLLALLFPLGTVDGVHRESLAVGLLIVLIAVTLAEGWAGYRLRTVNVVPLDGAIDAATSGSVTGMSVSPTGVPGEPDGRAVEGGPPPDHQR